MQDMAMELVEKDRKPVLYVALVMVTLEQYVIILYPLTPVFSDFEHWYSRLKSFSQIILADLLKVDILL